MYIQYSLLIFDSKGELSMNFGEYFRGIMSKYDITLTDLANASGVKSKNELYRLIENKYSYEKTSSLVNKICNVFSFTDLEKNMLLRLMEELKTPYSVRCANEILAELFVCDKRCEDIKFKPFTDFIERNKKHEMTVFLGTLSVPQTEMMYKALSACGGEKLHVNHILSFNASDETVAERLYTIVRLFQFDCYNFYEDSGHRIDESFAFSVNDDSVTLAIFDKGSFLESTISFELTAYFMKKYDDVLKRPLKENKGKIGDYIELMSFSSVVDVNDIYSTYGMQCVGDIPYDICCSLFEDANYFGFPKEHPYVAQLDKVMYDRAETRKASGCTKHYFLAEKYVRDFLTCGKVIDYLECLRPLSPDERVKMLERFWKHEGGARFSGRFFKEEYSPILTEFVYIENVGIYISSSGNGYDKLHAQTIISHPKAMKVVKNFTSRFWNECTLSEKESIDKLKGMINEYFNWCEL